MRIPSPRELGFPAKFDSWRPPQIEALQSLLSSVKRVKAFCGPTGFGKTAVYMAYAIITKLSTCFVVPDNGLLEQLMDDFQGVGLVSLKGRRNYTCDLKPDYTCEDGYAARCPHKGTINCPSSQAEMRAATSPLVVTNYDKWTSAKKYGQGMEHFKQVVFDEGHESPNKLASALQVVLHHREIEDVLEEKFLAGSQADEFVNWKEWAGLVKVRAMQMLKDALADIQGHDPRSSAIRHYMHMRNLTRRLSILSTASPTNWIVDGVKEGFQFDPIQVGRYAESALFLKVPSILVVSATLRPKTLFMLGVSQANFDYREFASDFDPKRCPIYYIPTMQVDNRAHDLSMLWLRHDQLAARRTDRKGITHTISFAKRDDIYNVSRFAPWMLLNERGEPTIETVDEFRKSPPGTIFVSPSVGAGYDFPLTDCEWQFVCKIPFPDGRQKIVRARQEADKEYGPYQAINKLVQIFGRGMRIKIDQCEGFIGDDHMKWFIPRYAHLAPKSFHERYRVIASPPAPPPRLEVSKL